MTLSTTPILGHALAMLTALALASGCSVGPTIAEIGASYDNLVEQEMAHHQHTMDEDDLDEIQEETEAYCAAMGEDIEGMLEMCDEMMGGGMMGGGMMGGMGGDMMDMGDLESLQGAMEHMAGAMEEHCSAMEDVEDSDEAHEECEEHHEEMVDLLEDGDDAVPGDHMGDLHCVD